MAVRRKLFNCHMLDVCFIKIHIPESWVVSLDIMFIV